MEKIDFEVKEIKVMTKVIYLLSLKGNLYAKGYDQSKIGVLGLGNIYNT